MLEIIPIYRIDRVDLSRRTVFSMNTLDLNTVSLVLDLNKATKYDFCPYRVEFTKNTSGEYLAIEEFNTLVEEMNKIKNEPIPVNYDTAVYLMMENELVISPIDTVNAKLHFGWSYSSGKPKYTMMASDCTYIELPKEHQAEFPTDATDKQWCIVIPSS